MPSLLQICAPARPLLQVQAFVDPGTHEVGPSVLASMPVVIVHARDAAKRTAAAADMRAVRVDEVTPAP